MMRAALADAELAIDPRPRQIQAAGRTARRLAPKSARPPRLHSVHHACWQSTFLFELNLLGAHLRPRIMLSHSRRTVVRLQHHYNRVWASLEEARKFAGTSAEIRGRES